LDGGPDGLGAYRAIISQTGRLLAANGVLIVEVGQGQDAEVERLMTSAGLTHEGPAKADLAGIPRAVGARNMPR
jgi:release factor glutamine methyltransferase